MTSEVDRKTYWDLFETIRWVQTRDEGRVAAIWDWSDDERMAVALDGMKVPFVVRSPPWPSTDRGADCVPARSQGSARSATHPVDEILRKVQSGRVRMTAIRCDGTSPDQITMPLAELNDLQIRLIPGHPVAPVGLWSRLRGTRLWRSPQFLSVDVIAEWPARNPKTAPLSNAILRHLHEIMTPEAPLTKVEAQRRCLAEVPQAYPQAFKRAWAALEPSRKRGRGKHGPRGR